MIIANTEDGILLRWRDEEERQERRIPFSEFWPYFFIESSNIVLKDKIVLYEGRQKPFFVNLFYEEGDWFNLDGQKLLKVTWTPSRTRYTKSGKMISKIRTDFHNSGITNY